MGHYDDEREYEYEKQRVLKKEALEAALKNFREFRSYSFKPNKGWALSHIRDGEKLFNRIETNIKAELYELRDIKCA